MIAALPQEWALCWSERRGYFVVSGKDAKPELIIAKCREGDRAWKRVAEVHTIDIKNVPGWAKERSVT